MQTKVMLGGKLLWTPNMAAIGVGGAQWIPPGSYGVGLWKYIKRGWRIFSSHTRFDPGDEMRIRFWDNV
jgi:hypothetical protein